MNKGDIILIPFPFTDLSGNKLRPAVLLYSGQKDVTVCFITTQTKWVEKTDIYIEPSQINGIKKPSLIRLSKIATIDKSLVIGLIGTLSKQKCVEMNNNLIALFQLRL